MTRKSDIDVLIVGAGPVGMMAALHLARRGQTVRIIDQAERTNQESFALALHPSALEIFENVGLAEKLINRGRRVESVKYFNGKTPAASLAMSALPTRYPFVLVIPQGELERTLVAALLEEGVAVEWGNQLQEVFREDSIVRATASRLKNIPQGYAVSDMRRVASSHEEIRARFLVGADGAHSTVRRLIGARVVPFGVPRAYSVFEFDAPQPLENELRIVLTDIGTSALWPMMGHRGRWTFEIEPGRAALPVVSDLRMLIKERAPWFKADSFQMRWAGRVTFARWYAEPFVRGRVWLAGDAGHQTGPFGIQSMNGGLHESAYLSSLIADLKPGQDPSIAAREYDEERRKYWQWVMDKKVHGQELSSDDPFIQKNMDELVACIPGTGANLKTLFEALSPVEAPA